MLTEEKRKVIFKHMGTQTFDLLVIGGGITGVGIALDAQTRGIRTALIEMHDFASGTSSRSTKLVHGGLRYLKQLQVKVVAEVGRERAIVYENGPHVTTPERMLLPIYRGGTYGKISTSLGLRLYDFLAGVRREERRKMLSAKMALEKEPLLKKDGLIGGGYYVEYRTDDARLTIEVLKQAVHEGTVALNYVKAENFLYQNGKTVGVRVIDQIDGDSTEIRARKVVNAAGPWVDTLRARDGSKRGKTLRLTKGVHLVVDARRFPLRQSVYFDTPDGRMVFAIPRDGKTYIGTTDTDYSGDISHPRMTTEDRDYLIRAVNTMFPQIRLNPEDIESSWTGLRPLIHEEGKHPSEISRKDEIFHSPSGLITIAGGKLTGYRKMAESIVNLVARELVEAGSGPYTACRTKTMPISGGHVQGTSHFPTFLQAKIAEGVQLGLTAAAAEKLARRYGSNIDKLYQFAVNHRKEAEESTLPLDIFLSLSYGLEEEMVVKPTDYCIRRTGELFFDIAKVQNWKGTIIDYMSQKLHWSDSQKKRYRDELDRELSDAVCPLA